MGNVLTDDGRIIVRDLAVATTRWQKFRGLMFNRSLTPDEGLLIEKCQAIHCCFMFIPIDVLFISTHGEIVHMVERMAPWTFSRIVFQAYSVLECFPGTIAKHELKMGQRLVLQSALHD